MDKELFTLLDTYLKNNKDKNIENPIVFVATLGFNRLKNILKEAIQKEKSINFEYKNKKQLNYNFI